MQGIIVLIVYALLMVGATKAFTKREDGGESFHVGHRNMGMVVSAMSIAATWIWAPALFTSAEKAYSNGIAGLFWFLVPNILCLILFIPFARKIRRDMPDGITLSGYMHKKYKSEPVKRVYLFQLTALTILSTAVQLLAGGKILSTATGLPLWAMTIVLAVIAFSYSQISGIKASVFTDAIQMVFLLLACAIFVPWALKLNGGAAAIQIAGASGDYGHLFSEKGLEVFLGFGLPTAIGLFAGPFGDQCFWQRAFSIRKDRIGRSFGLGAVMFAVVPLSMGILGFIAAGTGFIPTDTGMVNFELIKAIFPAWVIIPFMFILISGLLSTVDSNLCAIASLTTDLKATARLKDADQIKASKAYRVFSDSVQLTIESAMEDPDFVRFIVKEQDSKQINLSLSQLMILRYIVENRKIKFADVQKVAQISAEEARKCCAELMKFGLIEITGKEYMLTARVYEAVKSDIEYTRDKTVQYIKAKDMITEYIKLQGYINRSTVQELCGFTDQQARRTIEKMKEENIIEMSNGGRYAKYILKEI